MKNAEHTQIQEYFYSNLGDIQSSTILETFLQNGVILNEHFLKNLSPSLLSDGTNIIYKTKPKITDINIIKELFFQKKSYDLFEQGKELIEHNDLYINYNHLSSEYIPSMPKGIIEFKKENSKSGVILTRKHNSI